MAWTRTQQCIWDVLQDRLPHHKREVHACLPDDLGPLSNIRAHLTAMRTRLRPQGLGIACQMLEGEVYYQLVQLVKATSEGAVSP